MKVLKLSYDVKAFCSVRLVLGYLSRKLSLHPEKISPDKIAVYINIFFIMSSNEWLECKVDTK